MSQKSREMERRARVEFERTSRELGGSVKASAHVAALLSAYRSGLARESRRVWVEHQATQKSCIHTPTDVVFPEGVDLSDVRCTDCKAGRP